MRVLILGVLLLGPLAGCIGGPALATGVFSFDPIVRGDPAPVPVQDCFALLEELNDRADAQARVRLAQGLERVTRHWIAETGVDLAADSSDGAAVASGAGGAQVTGTNNQEAGVDEADVLKTDGEWTYVLRGGDLLILRSRSIGDVELWHRMEIGGWGGQLLLADRGTASKADDRIVVIAHGSQPDLGALAGSGASPDLRHYGMTRILVLDLANRTAPAVLDETWIEGSVEGARLVDGVVHVVVHDREEHLGLQTWAHPQRVHLEARNLTYETYERLPEISQRRIAREVAYEAVRGNREILAGLTLRDHLPTVLHMGPDGLVPEALSTDVCQRLLLNRNDTGRSVSTILSIDVTAQEPASKIVQVAGGRPIVYGATDALVLAAPSNDVWWFWAQPDLEEATNIHWFDLDGLEVTHRASGRIDGIVQDQFGIDVHAGQLRVATTTGTWGRWWLDDPEPMMNHVAVLQAAGAELEEVGRVGGIAPGERLWSARFTDERAYLITFEQIDPLWVIDLADPTDPRILGELEIPGVSTYIHPLGDDALLAIGYGPGADGQGLDWGRIQVSLFDISDVSKPKRADVMDISTPGGWSSSAAVREHKAFTYWSAIGVLAVPVQQHQSYRVGDSWVYESHVALRLIDVDDQGLDLSLRGEVDHDHLLGDHWYGGIERSYFMGFPQFGLVSVYAMSGAGITAHDLEDLSLQDSVAFG